MSTRVSHHSCISSSLTRCHIPSPLCKPGDQRLQGVGQGEEGPERRGLARFTPHPPHSWHMQTFWGLYSAALEAVLCLPSSVGSRGFHRGRSPILTSRGQSEISTGLSDSSYSVPLSTVVPSPFLPSLASLNNEPGLQGRVEVEAAPATGQDRRKVCQDVLHPGNIPSLTHSPTWKAGGQGSAKQQMIPESSGAGRESQSPTQSLSICLVAQRGDLLDF